MHKLQLLQPGSLAWNAAQRGAAAAAMGMMSGIPILVIDPWQLLPPLLSSIGCRDSSCNMAGDQWVMISPADVCCAANKAGGGACESRPAHNTQPAKQHLHKALEAFDRGHGIHNKTLWEVQQALLAGRNVCLQMKSCSTILAVQLLQAVVSMYGCMFMPQTFNVDTAEPAGSNSTALGAAPGAAWQLKLRPRHNSIAAGGGRGWASSLPSLVVHVGSRCCSLTADVVGSFHVIDLGGLQDIDQQQGQPVWKLPDAAVTALQQPAFKAWPLLQATMFEQQVQRLLLAASAGDEVEAVANATAKAEARQQQADRQEAQLMRHLSQVWHPLAVRSCRTASVVTVTEMRSALSAWPWTSSAAIAMCEVLVMLQLPVCCRT
jgi:hypothetical protein